MKCILFLYGVVHCWLLMVTQLYVASNVSTGSQIHTSSNILFIIKVSKRCIISKGIFLKSLHMIQIYIGGVLSPALSYNSCWVHELLFLSTNSLSVKKVFDSSSDIVSTSHHSRRVKLSP